MIRETSADDVGAIMAIIQDSGQFDETGLEHVRLTLEDHLQNGSDALWFTAIDGDPVGVAYCAPEPVTVGTWNLLMLWVQAGHEGSGMGTALVRQIERSLNERDARLLIVETSGLPEFENARKFYDRAGFKHEARVANFFDQGDDKLIYTRSVS